MVDMKIENVYKYYAGSEDIAAVHDLNMEVKDGEFVAILAPSGCGKSSTMRMISGLEHISAGTISFGGEVVNEMAPKDRDIAMVFENCHQFRFFDSGFGHFSIPLLSASFQG